MKPRDLRQDRRESRQGSTLVEGAMVTSLFLLLAVSVIDLGQFAYHRQALMERTRIALRAGAAGALTPAQIAAMVVYSRPQAPAGQARGFQGLTLENVTVQVLEPGGADARIIVRIHGFKYPGMTPLLGNVAGAFDLRMASPLETP